jgi:hypothetical protein
MTEGEGREEEEEEDEQRRQPPTNSYSKKKAKESSRRERSKSSKKKKKSAASVEESPGASGLHERAGSCESNRFLLDRCRLLSRSYDEDTRRQEAGGEGGWCSASPDSLSTSFDCEA